MTSAVFSTVRTPIRRSAIVIGAGLAGATMARALARANWQVQVLERAAQPAAGASALPVGLMSPTLPKNPAAARSDWQINGIATTTQLLIDLSHENLLVPGQDWQACGSWMQQKQAKRGRVSNFQPSTSPANSAVFMEQAAWVKPAALISACLNHPNISFHGNCEVVEIMKERQHWRIEKSNGDYAMADAIFICAALGSKKLLDQYPEWQRWRAQLHATAGQVIFAPWSTDNLTLLPEFASHGAHACNGHGHFIPAVPISASGEGKAQFFWLSGASYDHSGDAQLANCTHARAENLQRLCELLPAFAPHAKAQEHAGELKSWAGVRCTTQSREPVCVEITPRLWLNAGMGSRGLSYAALAAQQILKKIEQNQ